VRLFRPNVEKMERRRDAEGLLRAMGDRDHAVRVEAMRASGRLRNTRAVDSLCAALWDDDHEVRCSAAVALGEIGDARAVESLCKKLHDRDIGDVYVTLPNGKSEKLLAVVAALGRIGECAVEPLCAALRDVDDNYVRCSAVRALTKIGDTAVEPLCAALRDGVRKVRGVAAEVLGEIGDVRAVGPLCESLHDTNVRVWVAEALGKLGDARAVEPLCAALRDDSLDGRVWAATALGKIGDARAVEPLCAALRDEVRRIVVEAFGEIGDVHAVEESSSATLLDFGRMMMVEAFGKIGDVRAVVREALGAIGAARVAPSAILRGLGWRADDAVAAAEALLEIETAGAVESLRAALRGRVEPLYAALRDGDPEVRGVAATALGKIGDARAVEPLCAALRDEVRRTAVEAAGEIGDARAMEALRDNPNDRDACVATAKALAKALGKIGDVRAVVAEALGEIGAARAVECLYATMRDYDGDLRGSLLSYEAAEALVALYAKGLDTRAKQSIMEVKGLIELQSKVRQSGDLTYTSYDFKDFDIRIDNLARWRSAGGPRRWVEEHNGKWDYNMVLELRGALMRSEYWPIFMSWEHLDNELTEAKRLYLQGRQQASGSESPAP
jgi:HEAT repeat protein